MQQRLSKLLTLVVDADTDEGARGTAELAGGDAAPLGHLQWHTAPAQYG